MTRHRRPARHIAPSDAAYRAATGVVDDVFNTLGLPLTSDPRDIVARLTQALPKDVLQRFDQLEGSESARLNLIWENPDNALWLGVGLRAPMVRAQLIWLLQVLQSAGIDSSSLVLDVGAGCGVSSATIKRATGATVIAIEPGRGSAVASLHVAEKVGARVTPHEIPAARMADLDLGEIGAVVAQAVITYLQPGLSTLGGASTATRVHQMLLTPPTATADALAVFGAGEEARRLVVIDHAYPALWGFVLEQASAHSLVPDWSTAATFEFALPLGGDRQVGLAFRPGGAVPNDASRLIAMLIGS